jgi:hypothetical protein
LRTISAEGGEQEFEATEGSALRACMNAGRFIQHPKRAWLLNTGLGTQVHKRKEFANSEAAAVASELYWDVITVRFCRARLGILQKRHTTKKEIAMVKLVNRLVVMVLVGAIAGGGAFAKVIKKAVTFSEPMAVNGTVVKSGTYEAVFDDQTNELSLVKGRKVVARTPAQLEKRDERVHSDYEFRRKEGDSTNAVLMSVTLKGGDQASILNSGDSNAAGSQ